jgi:predicted DCC family thiol-disulfide oxidoreductase YuxK
MGRPAAYGLSAGWPATRRHARGGGALPFGATATDTLPQQALDSEGQTHPSGPLTVLFDADCGLRRETVRRLRRWNHDGRFEFMPLALASTSGRPMLEELAAQGHLQDSVHVVDEANGRIISGGHAALAILDALPGGWLFRPWAALPPTAAAADMVYRVASGHRDRVSWLTGLRDEVSCPIELVKTTDPSG